MGVNVVVAVGVGVGVGVKVAVAVGMGVKAVAVAVALGANVAVGVGVAHGCNAPIKLPSATGELPTATLVCTVLVIVLMTETLLLATLAT